MYFKPIKLEQIQLAVNQLVMESPSQSRDGRSAAAEGAADGEGPLLFCLCAILCGVKHMFTLFHVCLCLGCSVSSEHGFTK